MNMVQLTLCTRELYEADGTRGDGNWAEPRAGQPVKCTNYLARVHGPGSPSRIDFTETDGSRVDSPDHYFNCTPINHSSFFKTKKWEDR